MPLSAKSQYEIAYCVGSIVNYVLKAIQSTNQLEDYIMIMVASSLLITSSILKLLNQKSNSISVLIVSLILNLLCTYIFIDLNQDGILLFNEMYKNIYYRLLLIICYQNLDFKGKLVFVFSNCCFIVALDFQLQKILLGILCLILMFQNLGQNSSDLQLIKGSFPSRKGLQNSSTWNHDLENKLGPIKKKDFGSYNNYTNQEVLYKRSFKSLYKDHRTAVIMIDKDAKPIVYNSALSNVITFTNHHDLSFALMTLQIQKADKHSMLFLHKPACDSLKMKHSQNIHSTTSQQFKFHLNDILQQMLLNRYNYAQIIDYKSDYIESNYQIDITLKEENFTILFIDIKDKIANTTKNVTRKLMNQLFKSFSHEFSTSLNCIRILAENAKLEMEQTMTQKYIQPILNSCYILNSIVQDIRDYSMIISKNFILTFSLVNIKSLINETVQLFQDQLKMKGIALIVECEDISINTDYQRVMQCLVNLLSNASKFTNQGSIKITANIKMIEDHKLIEIAVQDTGIGMNEQKQQSLQQFLQQSYKQSLKSSQESYGIGLLISNHIAIGLCKSKINGGIRFETVSSKGSKFSFLIAEIHADNADSQSKYTVRYKQSSKQNTNKIVNNSQDSQVIIKHHLMSSGLLSNVLQIPKMSFMQQIKSDRSEDLSNIDESFKIDQPYLIQTHKHDREISITIQEPSEHSSRILIVDDEYTNIYALTIMLRNLNIKSDFANNGYEGLLKFQKNHYSIILMDIEMPVMNGLTASEKIMDYCFEHEIDLPEIIAQTAYTDSGTKQHCKESGMNWFLSKPISTLELKKLLLNLTAKK